MTIWSLEKGFPQAALTNRQAGEGIESEALGTNEGRGVEQMAKKRGNGEGSISRRKNGGWIAQYAVYTAEGRKRKTLYGKSRADVAAKLAKALSDREGGLTFDANNMKLHDYLSLWLTDSVRDSVRPATYEGYARQVRNHLTPTLGPIKLRALTPAHLRGLYRDKWAPGYRPGPYSTST